ncbi:ROK family protein [Polymorphospora rubra]|uniref:Sugar kinase n=1 Tax=Polymorphospora rubra TaxID=338584 RepID=A0A810MWV0_9ACTN|nr:ROK family protein [Polymorphospora rubra]BCJ64093.1 sugar kinase [Polymorphospora rubra]
MGARKPSTVRDLRRGNRAELLSAIYFDGPVSRHELIRATGLSSASVSNVTSELIESGAVVEAGAVDSEGGRPRILLRANPARGCVVGVSVGPRRLLAGAFDLTLRERSRVTVPLAPGDQRPDEVVRRLLDAVAEVLADAAIDPAAVLGLGVGVSGVVEHGPDPLVSDQTMGWSRLPLERLLRAGTDLPLFIDNGAKNMGRAEMWFGAGRGAQQAVIALVSSGVGAAIVTNGVIYQGASSSAGEWGHMKVEVGGRRCRCGARGCLEAYVGAEAVVERYHQLAGIRPEPTLDEQALLRQIVAEAGATGAPNSEVARRVLDETAVYLGVGVANLINLVNPERIIVGGWAGLLLGDVLLPQLREAARENALRTPFGHTTIDLALLGADAAIVGAATLPVAEFLRTGGVAREVSGQAPPPRRAVPAGDGPVSPRTPYPV